MAIDNFGHVVLEERATFRHDHHAGLARSLDDLLTLIAPRLVVALDADRTDILHAPQMEKRVVEIRDVCFERSFSAVQDGPGRKDVRRYDHPRLLQFGSGEDLARGVR